MYYLTDMYSTRLAMATHILVGLEYLRREGRGLVSSQNLAKSIGTNPAFVRDLLQKLRNANLVCSTEGRGGGIGIAQDANKISLRDIYAAVEEKSVLKENPRPIYKSCPVSCSIKSLLRPIYDEVDESMLMILNKTKISDLATSVPKRTKN